MKIIFVTYYFPPRNSIASFRISSFAETFSKLGHDVLVIAPDWSKDKNESSPPYKILYTHKADDSVYTDSGNSLKDFIRREVFYKIFAYNNFRDRKPGKFFQSAKSCIDNLDLSQYDFVVSSFGPLDSIWIGKYIKEKYNSIKWIIDYRDYYSLFYKDFGIFKPHFRRWGQKLVNTCDDFITVSETLRVNISKLINKPGYVVYNGYLNFEISEDVNFEQKLLNFGNYLSYAGTLYHGHRDIAPFAKYFKENLEKKYKLIFALTDPLDVEYVRAVFTKLGVSNYEVLTEITHNQSLLLTKNASHPILFNHFDKRSNGFLTGKIYEYIFFKKRVIYSGPVKNNELYEMVRKYNWGESFEKFKFPDSSTIPEKNIIHFSRENQAKCLIDFLNGK